MSEVKNIDGAIAERPREIDEHPALERVYEHHDELISRYVRGRTLELAAGQWMHPAAELGLDIHLANAEWDRSVIADARELPFRDRSFDTIIGRRFIHHVPPGEQLGLLQETRRTLTAGGRLIVIEGTPGFYRRFVKGLARRLGWLGPDTDRYGHLGAVELQTLMEIAGFDIERLEPLGSPLMPLTIATGEWSRPLGRLVNAIGGVRWWTFAIGVKRA